ncbi:hypothetical protein Tco_0829839 [Tanacetum coccineum]
MEDQASPESRRYLLHAHVIALQIVGECLPSASHSAYLAQWSHIPQKHAAENTYKGDDDCSLSTTANSPSTQVSTSMDCQHRHLADDVDREKEELAGNGDSEPLLKSCGISITSNFIQVEGQVLLDLRLKVKNGEDFFPQKERWNFNNKEVNHDEFETTHIVFNHRGGFGAWCSYKTIALLQEYEIKVTAIDLSGFRIDRFDPNAIKRLS